MVLKTSTISEVISAKLNLFCASVVLGDGTLVTEALVCHNQREK